MTDSPAIPERMRHLPKVGNFVVPWSVEWTSRTGSDEDLVKSDPYLGLVLGCDCTIGQGKPIFAEQCLHRQAQSVRDRLCGMCGTELQSPYVWLDDNSTPFWSEPPSHPECFAYALATCPHLAAILRERSDLAVIEARDYRTGSQRVTDYRSGEGTVHDCLPNVPMVLHQQFGYFMNYIVEPQRYTRFNARQWIVRQRKRERRGGQR